MDNILPGYPESSLYSEETINPPEFVNTNHEIYKFKHGQHWRGLLVLVCKTCKVVELTTGTSIAGQGYTCYLCKHRQKHILPMNKRPALPLPLPYKGIRQIANITLLPE
jgi:hypothetical protein